MLTQDGLKWKALLKQKTDTWPQLEQEQLRALQQMFAPLFESEQMVADQSSGIVLKRMIIMPKSQAEIIEVLKKHKEVS